MIHKPGTQSGISYHRRRFERLCEECRVFHNNTQRELYHKSGKFKRTCKKGHELIVQVGSKRQCMECHEFDYSKCGTTAGESQHRRKGVEPCAPCRRAKLDYDRSRKKPKTHCKCGLRYEHFDSIGRPYCPDCRSSYTLERQRKSRLYLIEERDSLRMLGFSDREIASRLGIDIDRIKEAA